MLFNKKLNKQLENSINNESLWLNDESSQTEGQLSVDVYQTEKEIIVKSTIAGVKPEDLKISLHHDMLSIKGFRHLDKKINPKNHLYQECYWGPFSRSIILPFNVDNKNINAEIENGLLTITLIKSNPEKIKITLKD